MSKPKMPKAARDYAAGKMAEFRQRQTKKGLTEVRVWVPYQGMDRLKSYAAKLRKEIKDDSE